VQSASINTFSFVIVHNITRTRICTLWKEEEEILLLGSIIENVIVTACNAYTVIVTE